jgi:tRNA(fMet)-specific endonuclease VapC
VYLLDTNIISTFLDRKRNSLNLTKRILREPPPNLFISLITIEEIMRGALGEVNRLRKSSSVVQAYQDLGNLFEALHCFQVLPYTEAADQIYRAMTNEQKRVGTQDCRIAATAMSMGYIVVTANVSDFQKIGTVIVEDWTSSIHD